MWKYESYFQQGISHKQNKTNCQDSVLVQENDKYIIAALADGLGSLKHSEIAADTVTHTVCELFLNSNLPTDVYSSNTTQLKLRDELIRRIQSQLENKSEEMRISINDMNCTLVFVFVSKQNNCAIIGRLGDSAICIIKERGSIAINDSNSSANGTNAILDRNANEYLDLQVFDLDVEKICGFILTSDGLDDELYMKGSSHVNKAAELYFNAVSVDPMPKRVIASAIEKLTSDEDSTFDDDISIAVLSRIDRRISFAKDPTWLCSCGARNRIQDTYCQMCNNDFISLYKNIKFREHGGKTAFFLKINELPEEERTIVGLNSGCRKGYTSLIEENAKNDKTNADDVIVNNSAITKSSPKQNEKQDLTGKSNSKISNLQYTGEDEVKGKKSSGDNNMLKKNKNSHLASIRGNFAIVALLIGIFVLGTLAGGLFSKIFISNSIKELEQKIDDLTNIVESQNVNNSNDKTEQVPEGFVTLENGTCYLGDTKDGVPHGKGILFEDEKYYIGTFENGKKDGEFTIIICGDKNVIITSYYDDDIEIESNNDEDASDDDSKAENNDNSNDENEDDKLNSDNNTDTSTQPPDTQLSDGTSM